MQRIRMDFERLGLLVRAPPQRAASDVKSSMIRLRMGELDVPCVQGTGNGPRQSSLPSSSPGHEVLFSQHEGIAAESANLGLVPAAGHFVHSSGPRLCAEVSPI